MTKREKTLAKLRNNPQSVRFEDLDGLLMAYGFTRRQPSGGSSHYFYYRDTYRVTVPWKRPFVKTVYMKQVLQLLEEIDNE